MVVAAVACVQLGSAVAVLLFPIFGPLGILFLRVGMAAAVLLVHNRATWRAALKRDPITIFLYGLGMAVQNGCFLNAISRIPLGIAVSIGFIGPLVMAMISSRRKVDFAWILLAAGGILMLTPDVGGSLDPIGVALALCGAAGWASFIFFSRRLGDAEGGALPLAMAACCIIISPIALPAAVSGAVAHPQALLPAVLLAIFASALPLSLEYRALATLPAHRYGVLVSLEPVVASIIGFVLLGERIEPRGWAAIAMITCASLGVALTHFRARRLRP